MPEDLPSISSSRIVAADVARHSFGTARRGFDPQEVRAYLELLARELAACAQRDQELRSQLAGAEERARNPVIDESTLTAALGRQSAQVLRNAHEEAARITLQAEQSAADLVREAKSRSAEVRVEAESGAAERIAEAEIAVVAVHQQAREEAAASVEAARAEGEALVTRAREQCQAMLDEAQETRRRVLTDMAQRRRAMTLQIEQFRAARDELAASVLGVRDSVDRIVGDLARADDEARAAAADVARRRPVEQPSAEQAEQAPVAWADLADQAPAAWAEQTEQAPVAWAEQTEAEPAGTADAVDLVEPAGTAEPSGTAEAVEPAEPAEPVEGGSEEAGAIFDMEAAEQAISNVPAGASVPAGETAPAVASVPAVESVPEESVEEFGAAAGEMADEEVAPDRTAAAGIGTAARGARGADTVEGLFARLRASRQEQEAGDVEPVIGEADAGAGGSLTVAGATSAQGLPPTLAPEDEERHFKDPRDTEDQAHAVFEVDGPGGQRTGAGSAGPDPDGPSRSRRAELLDPVVAQLARRLKRALQDDQNLILDRLRGGSGEWCDDVLMPEDDQRALYADAAAAILREAVAAGITFSRGQRRSGRSKAPAPDEETVAEAAGGLATTVVSLIRKRLEDVATGTDSATELVGVAYREWRGERIERLAGDYALGAFSSGVLSGAGKGVASRWVLAGSGTACADCDDNALAGNVAPGEDFPTGHRHPPAHPGCRCLVVPTPA